MNVLLDCDGVILDYDYAFLSNFSGEKNLDNTKMANNFQELLKMDEQTILKMVTDFNESEHFEKIPAIKGARRYIRLLHNQGYNIHVITSCGNSSKNIEKRIKNLHTQIGDVFDNIICLPLHADKTETLRKWYGSKHIFVDDNPKHLQSGVDLGLFSVLFRSLFNNHINYGLIAENWWYLNNIINSIGNNTVTNSA